MKKILASLIIGTLFLLSCSPKISENAIKTAIAETEQAKPTETTIPTSTKEPTATVEPVLTRSDIVDGLLNVIYMQSGYEPGQIRFSPPGMFDRIDYPKEDDAYDMRITKNNNVEGGVTLLLYADPDKGLEAYEAIKIGNFGEDTTKYVEEIDQEQLLRVTSMNISLFSINNYLVNYCGRINILYSLDKYDPDATYTYLAYIISIVDDHFCPEKK